MARYIDTSDPTHTAAITLTWNFIADGAQLRIQTSPDGATGWADLFTTLEPVGEITVADYDNTKTDEIWYFRLRAERTGYTTSAWSNTKSVRYKLGLSM